MTFECAPAGRARAGAKAQLEIGMSKEQIAGIVRAVAAAVGGYFVGKGTIDGATMEIIAGSVATLAAAIWSVWAKKQA